MVRSWFCLCLFKCAVHFVFGVLGLTLRVVLCLLWVGSWYFGLDCLIVLVFGFVLVCCMFLVFLVLLV